MEEQEEDILIISVDQGTTTNTASKKSPSPRQSTNADSSGENGSPTPTTNETQERGITCNYRLALVLVIAPIIAIPVLPLMFALYFITYIVQAFRSDDDKKVDRFMSYLAHWLSICFALISIYLLLPMLIFGVTPSLKHRTLHGVSITRWIGVIVIICLFLTFSVLVHYLLCYLRLERKRNEETFHLDEGLIGAFSSLSYLFARFSVIGIAPILKEHTIVGLPTQKWVWIILLVVLGHHAVCVLTSSIVVSLRKYIIKPGMDRGDKSGRSPDEKWKTVEKFTKQSTKQGEKYLVYYAEGLRGGFNFVLTSLLLHFAWILYIGSRLNLSSSHISREVYDVGFWTVLCILVSAFVLLVKRGIFLTWEARVVHGRFCESTLCAAKKLCLIGVIAGKCIDSSGPFVDFSGTSIDFSGLRDIVKRNLKEEKEGEDKKKQNCATEEKKHDILPCAYDAKIMTRYLLDAEKQFSKVGYAPDFVRKWRRKILQKRRCEKENKPDLTSIGDETLNWYGEEIKGDNMTLFKTLRTKEGLNNGDFEKWIVKYLKQCLDHGRILAGELEWVHCLNSIMNAVLFGTAIVVWLFLTGIATTKVVVLITSPVLAASFIFGESCKTSFQGIMFTYVKRPFEVGEICTINDTPVKILKIGIRRTLCSRVEGTKDEVVYPNTMLATVPIVKHNGKQGSELELNDYMELRLNSATAKKESIKRLISEIKIYLGNNQDGFKKDPLGVLTNKIGDTLIIEVHFVYDKPSIGSLENKSERKCHFLGRMKKILVELDIQEKHPLSPALSFGVHETQTSRHERNKCICSGNK